MEGHGRRFRRQGRARSGTLLPLRSSTPLSNTISCWYCDLKISSFNEPLYRFGQKHARFLRMWFSVGTGFSLSVLFGVTLILIWESVATLCLSHTKLTDLFSSLLLGSNPSVFGFEMALIDVGYLIVSTMISVTVHEFGHAAAAASEGIQLEYIAIFLAVLFPGALVAFNYELLQAKPRSSALHIYCAGIWHNAVFCAACGLALLLLPLILSPLYIHRENSMVLDISSSSPVSGYLSSGDVIMSLDGTKIRNAVDWMEKAISLHNQTLARSEVFKGSLTIDRQKIYCAPSSLVQKRESMFLMTNQSACPDEHIAFVSISCSDLSADVASSGEYDVQKISDNGYCLSYADMVSIKTCGSLGTTTDSRSSCICSENELCLSPVQIPGIAWAAITYQSPYSYQCLKLEQNLTEPVESSGSGENCHKMFLFVGDVISMARSVRLTSFEPRFSFPFASYLPNMFEKFLVCTFQVSMALAILNSLPVYFLDGESILEMSSFYVTFLGPGKRRLILQACLLGGSIISFLVFLRIFLNKLWS